MSRGLNSSLLAELGAEKNRHATLVSIAFTSTTIRLASTNFDIVYNSQTYLGNGWLGVIQSIEESSDIRAVGVEILLIGVSPTVLSLALNNVNQNLDAVIYLAALSEAGAIIGEPALIWKGKVDTAIIEDSAEMPKVSIQCESYLARLNRTQNFRYSTESQAVIFPGDRGFEYTPRLENWTGYWGKLERPTWLRRRRPNAQPRPKAIRV